MHAQEEAVIISERECSKKSVQQGRSRFDARSVLSVREHDKKVRTPLAVFFNILIEEGANMSCMAEGLFRFSHESSDIFIGVKNLFFKMAVQ